MELLFGTSPQYQIKRKKLLGKRAYLTLSRPNNPAVKDFYLALTKEELEKVISYLQQVHQEL